MAGDKVPKERKFVSVSKSAETIDTEKNARKTKKAVANAAGRKETPETTGKTPKRKATSLRIISVILWLAAIGFEIFAISILNKMLYIPGDMTMWLIIGIGLDLVCVVIGSLLWKKANRIDPASEKNKVRFFLWNNMGVIAAIIAFVPLMIFLLKNKNLNAKTKKIVTVVAAIAMLLAVGLSIDYNPVSQEDMDQAQAEVGSGTVYWTRWGYSYHLDPDCHTLMNSSVVYQGALDEAFDAGRNDPCDFCAGGGEAKLEETETEEVTD